MITELEQVSATPGGHTGLEQIAITPEPYLDLADELERCDVLHHTTETWFYPDFFKGRRQYLADNARDGGCPVHCVWEAVVAHELGRAIRQIVAQFPEPPASLDPVHDDDQEDGFATAAEAIAVYQEWAARQRERTRQSLAGNLQKADFSEEERERQKSYDCIAVLAAWASEEPPILAGS